MTPARSRERRPPGPRAGLGRVLAQFAILVVLASAALAAVLAALVWIAMGVQPWSAALHVFNAAFGVAVLLLLGCLGVELARMRAGGGRHAAAWVGARELREAPMQQEKRLLAAVAEVSVAAGLPEPPVFVLEREEAIDAFNAGWSRHESVLLVTQGALERLLRDEMTGLVAHAMARIRHDDLHRDMVTLSLARALALVFDTGRKLLFPSGGAGPRAGARAAGLLPWVLGVPGWLAAHGLLRWARPDSVSRADAQAVRLARAQDGLGRALRKAWHQAEEGRFRFSGGRTALLARRFAVVLAEGSRSGRRLSLRLRKIHGHDVVPIPSERLRVDAVPAPPARGAELELDAGQKRPAARPEPRGQDEARAPAAGFPATMHVPRGTAAQALQAAAHPLTRMGAGATPGRLEREDRDAMNRFSLLHGPLERRTAVLALLLRQDLSGPALPGRPAARLSQWRREAAGLPSAERILLDARSLTSAAWLPWYEELIERTASAPRAEGTDLLDAAQRLCDAAGGPDVLDVLALQFMRVRLAGPALSPRPAMPGAAGEDRDAQDLRDLPALDLAHASVLTDLLASLAPAHWGWSEAVKQEWADRAPEFEPAPASRERAIQAVDALRRLHWTVRPQLSRLWVVAALRDSPSSAWPEGFADGLRLACRAIDTPLPEDVAARYAELPR